MEEGKKCTKCAIYKSINLFPRSNSKYYPSGFRPECFECYRDARQKYFHKNHEVILKQKRDYYREHFLKASAGKKQSRIKAKRAALLAYSGEYPKCACCLESTEDLLCIDHSNGGGNEHRRSVKKLPGYAFYVWLKKNGYPNGFRVLCWNCNESFASNGFCPHYPPNVTPVKSLGSQYAQRLRMRSLSAYSNGNPKCNCCGVMHVQFLCLDHVGGGGAVRKQETGTSSRLHRWLFTKEFPVGFQVLCHNCNWSSHIHGKCPFHAIS